MQECDPLPEVGKEVTQNQIQRYAVASGDFNPVHIDQEFASRSTFGGTIAHGMMIAAFISEMMTVAFRESWLRGGRLKIRFSAPVYPGDTITTFGHVNGIHDECRVRRVTCSIGVRRQTGEIAIQGNASFTVRVKGE